MVGSSCPPWIAYHPDWKSSFLRLFFPCLMGRVPFPGFFLSCKRSNATASYPAPVHFLFFAFWAARFIPSLPFDAAYGPDAVLVPCGAFARRSVFQSFRFFNLVPPPAESFFSILARPYCWVCCGSCFNR